MRGLNQLWCSVAISMCLPLNIRQFYIERKLIQNETKSSLLLEGHSVRMGRLVKNKKSIEDIKEANLLLTN